MISCKVCLAVATFLVFDTPMCTSCMYKAQEGIIAPVTYIGDYTPVIHWRSCEDFPPPERDLLVWSKCGMPHIAMWRYETHVHTECCYRDGEHFAGDDIEFTHWSELPVRPL